MAYTYDDFVSAATSAGLMESFSDNDLNIAKSNPEYGISMVKLQQDLNNSTTTEQKLLTQEAINQLRTSYGNLAASAATSFTYDQQNEYQKLLDSVTNQGSFTYDAAEDPSYGALKKSYLREGERAREDTLAKVSAATGGTPSSYAVTAAQQAGDYYSEKLGDAIPTLQQNAYQRYLNDFSTKLNALSAMETDRTFDFNAYLQKYEQAQDAKAEEQQKFANALALYQTLGYATPEVAEILGINSGYVSSGYSGGSGGSSSRSGGGGGIYNTIPATYITALKDMYPSGVITNQEIWNKWVAQYGEAAMNAAGFSFGEAAGIVNRDAYTITNKNNPEQWVAVGSSRMTWPELENLIDQGKIVEKYDDVNQTVTFVYASSGSKSNNTTKKSSKSSSSSAQNKYSTVAKNEATGKKSAAGGPKLNLI